MFGSLKAVDYDSPAYLIVNCSKALRQLTRDSSLKLPPVQIGSSAKERPPPVSPTGTCTPPGLLLKITAMKRRLALLSLVLFPALAICEPAKEAEKPAAATTAKASKVKLTTGQGVIVLELNAEKAPVTVENFLGYVKKKHYNGTVFHRIIDGFMIQGGGFALEGKDLVEKDVGDGIVNESKNGLKNERGTIAMARTNDPNSATAQFFINVKDNAMLDFPNNNGYAVFGKVVEGMDVVDKIKAVATGTSMLTMKHPVTGEKLQQPSTDVPVEKIVITSASVE
jgi:peptidyl-prolyl cis-trans isomerase A (cyclophilin A)